MNILCWEGYNSDQVLGPFRSAHPDASVRAESGTSDPDMINKLRAGETSVWDLINVNQPWARDQLYPEGLIKPLNKERFMPYFEKMLPEFANPAYPLAFADDGNLIGMPQRYGPFSFVVNTDVISRETAEDQGWNLFLDPAMKGRFGVLTYDNWNVIHMCLTAGLNPFAPVEGGDVEKFRETAKTIFGGAKLLTDDLVAMNTALINGEIDAYFTGGTYTASPARYDGATNVRAITPNSGPVDGKGGCVWIELTSAVNNPNPSDLAEDFLEFVQAPDIAKAVAFTEGTYNPVAQMGNPEVMAQFDADELDAIQMDSLEEEMARSLDYDVVASYDTLIEIYTQERRS
jgi:spermidine/putrescine transport system substrate-binding protein